MGRCVLLGGGKKTYMLLMKKRLPSFPLKHNCGLQL